MLDLGCQDTDWVGGRETDVSHAILLRNGLILVPLGMDKGKCGYLRCIFGWFGALRGAPWVTDGLIWLSGYRLRRWKAQRGFRCNFTAGQLHTSYGEINKFFTKIQTLRLPI